MRWASSISTESRLRDALASVQSEIQAGLDGAEPTLVLAFATAAFRNRRDELLEGLESAFPSGLAAGALVSGVLGNDQEVEHGPALSVLAGSMPGTTAVPVYIHPETLPSADAAPGDWRDWLGNPGSAEGEAPPALNFLLLVDPFFQGIQPLLDGFAYAYPDSTVIGGMVSGSAERGENMLFLDHHRFDAGAIAIALHGDHQLTPLVAQGCRPVGRSAPVQRASRNTIVTIDGQPAVEWLNAELELLSTSDRKRAKTHLFIGLSLDPFSADPQHGDFLVRHLIGIDYNAGALIVGGEVSEGQLIRLHLRDQRAAHEDLDAMLRRAPSEAAAALSFSCLGRGQFLYQEAHHDAKLLQEHLGPLPHAGFFCNGEIGPVTGSGGTPFIHGYTNVIGLFHPRPKT